MNPLSLKSSENIVTEIIMSRSAHKTAFLILEGESDSRFFRRRIDSTECEIVIAGGKPCVVKSIGRLNERSIRGALGIVDDDCDSIDGRHIPQPNLIPIADGRDLEAVLIWSRAFDGVIAEYADPAKVTKLGGVENIRNKLITLALPFGSLRRWSSFYNKALDFKSLPPIRFIEPNWDFKHEEFYSEVIKQVGLQMDVLLAQIDALPVVDSRYVCQGHDLISILAIGMSKKGGILGSSNPSLDNICGMLRQALDDSSWRSLRLAADIVDWEAANQPFRCLP